MFKIYFGWGFVALAAEVIAEFIWFEATGRVPLMIFVRLVIIGPITLAVGIKMLRSGYGKRRRIKQNAIEANKQ